MPTIRENSTDDDIRFRQSGLLRQVFETVVRRCIDEGLVGGDGFAVDASLIAADANKQRSLRGEDWNIADLPAGQAVREYLATLDDAAFGAASPKQPKFISPSDPAAQWTSALPCWNSHQVGSLFRTVDFPVILFRELSGFRQ